MIRLSATFAFVLPAVVVAGCGDASPAPSPGGTPGRSSAGGSAFLASRPIQSVNGKIDLGAVNPCGEKLMRTERIRNQSKETVEILGYASNCGCLDAKLIGSRTLAPGEEREIKLTVNPSGSGTRSIAVEFAAAGGFAGTLHGRQQQAHEHTDDGDHDEQLHEREAAAAMRTRSRYEITVHGCLPFDGHDRSSISLISGMNRAITMKPTAPPRKMMSNGSIRLS
jgi:hypothetical protein